MSRRSVNPARRIGDGGNIPLMGGVQSKSRSSPLLSIGLLVVVLLSDALLLCVSFISLISINKGGKIASNWLTREYN